MPKIFMDCIKNGGRVRTKRLNKEEYIKICYPKGGGKSVAGEKHKYKKVLKK